MVAGPSPVYSTNGILHKGSASDFGSEGPRSNRGVPANNKNYYEIHIS
mgnify:CR=1 FL=1